MYRYVILEWGSFLFRHLNRSSAILSLMVFIACDLVELQQHVLFAVPDRLFKRHGRWRSENAKDGYVKDSFNDLLFVSKNLGIYNYLFWLNVLQPVHSPFLCFRSGAVVWLCTLHAL